MGYIYAHARADYLDLNVRSQWLGRKKRQSCIILTSKQTINIKLATTVGLLFFYMTLTVTLTTSIWLDHFVFFFVVVSWGGGGGAVAVASSSSFSSSFFTSSLFVLQRES